MPTLESYLRIFEEICDECCPPSKYCLLKEIVFKNTPRTIIQIKCIEKFKYEQSQKEGHDIGWNGASAMWVSQGYAEIFGKLFSEDKHVKDLYKEIMVEKSKQSSQ